MMKGDAGVVVANVPADATDPFMSLASRPVVVCMTGCLLAVVALQPGGRKT